MSTALCDCTVLLRQVASHREYTEQAVCSLVCWLPLGVRVRLRHRLEPDHNHHISLLGRSDELAERVVGVGSLVCRSLHALLLVKTEHEIRIPTIVCAANLGICVGYWAFERRLPKQYRPPLGKDARMLEGWSKRYFGLKSLYQLSVDARPNVTWVEASADTTRPLLFWVLCGTRECSRSFLSLYVCR